MTTASDVKRLRSQTNAGMMDCKKALEASNGDFDAAVEWLKARGAVRSANRAERETPEGRIGAYVSPDKHFVSIVEVGCETDFVARTDDFVDFVNTSALLLGSGSSVEDLDEARQTLSQRTGENIVIRRARVYMSVGHLCASYVHHDGTKGAVIIVATTNAEDFGALGRRLAMQLASLESPGISCDEFMALPYILDPSVTVREMLKNTLDDDGAFVVGFEVYSVGS